MGKKKKESWALSTVGLRESRVCTKLLEPSWEKEELPSSLSGWPSLYHVPLSHEQALLVAHLVDGCLWLRS